MRVIVIAPGYPPAGGGVEVVVGAVNPLLAARGLEIEVWAPDRTTTRPTLTHQDGLVVRRFPSTQSVRYGVSPSLFRYAARHLHGADLVHAHSYHVTAVLAALLTPRSTPVVLTPHLHVPGYSPIVRLLDPIYGLAASKVVRRAAAIVAVSEAESVLLTGTFPGIADRYVVIRNAVDVKDLHSAQPFTDERPTVVVLGRLENYKRVDLAIRAFSACSTDGQLVVIGDGPERDNLRRLASRVPRSADIRFTGYIERKEVTRWLRTARGLVNMSQMEAFGIVAYEGAAAGAAVTLSNLPAHREAQNLTPPGTVSLVDNDIRAVSREIDRLLQTPNSGPRPIRDWSEVVDEHLALYKRLAGRAR